MPGTKKTDNHYLADKVALRCKYSPWLDDRPLRVLDVCGGHGVVWRCVMAETGRKIARHAIDKRTDLSEMHWHGDNLAVIQSVDVSDYDVVDIDAYGTPAEHLMLLSQRQFQGVVFVTMIQEIAGRMPSAVMSAIGLPMAAQTLAPSLIARRGWEYYCEFLSTIGVRSLVHRSKGRKHYAAMRLNGAALPANNLGSLVADMVEGHA